MNEDRVPALVDCSTCDGTQYVTPKVRYDKFTHDVITTERLCPTCKGSGQVMGTIPRTLAELLAAHPLPSRL